MKQFRLAGVRLVEQVKRHKYRGEYHNDTAHLKLQRPKGVFYQP